MKRFLMVVASFFGLIIGSAHVEAAPANVQPLEYVVGLLIMDPQYAAVVDQVRAQFPNQKIVAASYSIEPLGGDARLDIEVTGTPPVPPHRPKTIGVISADIIFPPGPGPVVRSVVFVPTDSPPSGVSVGN